jgi:hypothetical protein
MSGFMIAQTASMICPPEQILAAILLPAVLQHANILTGILPAWSVGEQALVGNYTHAWSRLDNDGVDAIYMVDD